MNDPNLTRIVDAEKLRKAAAINGCIGPLMALRQRLRAAYIEPTGIVLPAALDPGKYEGDDATDAPARLMGLPVAFLDGWAPGLYVGAGSLTDTLAALEEE